MIERCQTKAVIRGKEVRCAEIDGHVTAHVFYPGELAEPAADPQPEKGWLKPILEQTRADINARPEWQKSRVVPAAEPKPEQFAKNRVSKQDLRRGVVCWECSAPQRCVSAETCYALNNAAEPAAPAPAAHLLSASDVAKKLVNVGDIDRREKILKQWVDSYIARWAAELEQVKAERDQFAVVLRDIADGQYGTRAARVAAEAALGEKGKR